MLLDSVTIDILHSIKNRRWLNEEEIEDEIASDSEETNPFNSDTKSFEKDSEPYIQVKDAIKSLFPRNIVAIEYFKYSKSESDAFPKIELVGSLDNKFNFMFTLGSTNNGASMGVKSDASGKKSSSDIPSEAKTDVMVEIDNSTGESIRLLWVFYETKFKEIYTNLTDASN
jgi:hypothetical protein